MTTEIDGIVNPNAPSAHGAAMMILY